MAKWADYLISGVWFTQTTNSKFISHVMLHVDSAGTSIPMGRKATKSEVISLIKAGNRVKTIKWDYFGSTWALGARVDYETRGLIQYLRTVEDNTVTDNLDNLLCLNGLFPKY